MRSTLSWGAAAVVWLLAIGEAAAIEHGSRFSRRHSHHNRLHRSPPKANVKRSVCEFPKDAGLVEVDPQGMNGGWAMSPDQPCKPGHYCPYACPPGQLMAQWSPDATTYSYPESMDGGLYCDEDGQIHKPFPDKPYCYDGTGTVSCKNETPKSVAFCQTVLPGNEAMLIPTDVQSSATLAVPDTSYWAGTAAHYYINPPGVSSQEACVWGTKDKPVGNWSPYVAGTNAAESGETFVKLGWNPIYIEPDVTFRDVVPEWGVRIECDGDCSGLPCEIDPNKHGVNECSQNNAPGAGGATFCVVAVPKGVSATIVVFPKDGAKSDDISVESYGGSDKEAAQPGDDDGEKPSSSAPTPTPSSSAVETPSPTTTTEVPATTSVDSTSSSSTIKSTSSSQSSSTISSSETTSIRTVHSAAPTHPSNGTITSAPDAPAPEETSPAPLSSTHSMALVVLAMAAACALMGL